MTVDMNGIRTAAIVAMALSVAGCWGTDEPTTATIVVKSEPAGGDVSLSGRPLGKTPTTVENVEPDDYVVRVWLDGYRTFSRRINIEAGQTRHVTARLARETAFAMIESEPPGAKCYHQDGTLLGETPIQSYVPRGSYTMRFTKKNYEEAYVEVHIKADTTTEVVATLRPFRATVMVTSRPTRSKIYIDEVDTGRTTPASIEISPGFRTIGVALPGFNREERDLNIDPNAAPSVHFELVPGNVPARMVEIEAGEFIMGSNDESPDERPRRKVYVETFYIDKFEVTNIRYRRFDSQHVFPPELANHPAVNVTWHDAAAYAAWAGKRLPTEEEWEKAARGVEGQMYPWGNAPEPAPEVCNIKELSVALMKSVGLRARVMGRSPYGCYDMAGNVWEWCSDWYGPYPGSKMTVGTEQVRVIRGGAYTETGYHARCSNRHYERPSVKRQDIGFRCAMSSQEAAVN